MRITPEQAVRITDEKIGSELSRGGTAFSDVFGLLSGSHGKLLRTRFGVLCGTDKKGTVDEKVTDRLCALELLHLATLVHDDIIDCAETRRGLPSVQAAFGKHGAVIAGDYLFTRSFSLVSDCEPRIIGLFSRAVAGVCTGEMRQEKHSFDRNQTVMGYLRTVSGKTAALFATAAVAGKDESVLDCRREAALLSIGHKFGVAFQIEDDISDFCPHDNTKPVGRDLAAGVITLPVIYILERDRKQSDAEITANIGYGIEMAEILAEKYRAKAMLTAERVDLPEKTALSEFFFATIGKNAKAVQIMPS